MGEQGTTVSAIEKPFVVNWIESIWPLSHWQLSVVFAAFILLIDLGTLLPP